MRRTIVFTGLVLLSGAAIAAWAGGWSDLARPETVIAMFEQATGPKQKTKSAAPSGSRGVVAVEGAVARSATTRNDIRSIGTLRSDESVQISSEIAGRVAEFDFNEGETVNASTILLKLDDALARAELADAQARFELARANMDRARQLSKTGNVTEKAIDEATAALEIARSALELQRVRLEKHTIRAPFSGRVGMRNVSPGAYIPIGTPIVNIEKIDVLKIDFKLPEVFLTSVKVGQAVTLNVDAVPGRTFAGEIYAIDPQVDVNGRALRIRAKVQNADFVLRPGLFARLIVEGQFARQVVLVPESAIMPKGGEYFVYRVDQGKAKLIKVALGERRGTEVEVIEGVAANALVVTAGQLKLRDGAAVEVVENESSPPARKRG